MYKCLDCGNEDKFYGVVKEQGSALIYQNINKSAAGKACRGPAIPLPRPEGTVSGGLWAIQNNGDSDEVTWAYLASGGSWKGFHQVRSCAVCHSTNIISVPG